MASVDHPSATACLWQERPPPEPFRSNAENAAAHSSCVRELATGFRAAMYGSPGNRVPRCSLWTGSSPRPPGLCRPENWLPLPAARSWLRRQWHCRSALPGSNLSRVAGRQGTRGLSSRPGARTPCPVQGQARPVCPSGDPDEGGTNRAADGDGGVSPAQNCTDRVSSWRHQRRLQRLRPDRDARAGTYVDFVKHVVPELQRRGLYHKDYAGRRCGRTSARPSHARLTDSRIP